MVSPHGSLAEAERSMNRIFLVERTIQTGYGVFTVPLHAYSTKAAAMSWIEKWLPLLDHEADVKQGYQMRSLSLDAE